MQINKCTGAGLGDLLDVPGHCLPRAAARHRHPPF